MPTYCLNEFRAADSTVFLQVREQMMIVVFEECGWIIGQEGEERSRPG